MHKTKIKFIKLIILAIITACLGSFIVGKNIVYATSIDETTLVQLANQERQIRGLSVLTINPLLYFAAKSKAQDMMDKDYFDHFSPDGQRPWDFIRNTGYNYQMAGENLAINFQTSQGAHQAWMDSPAHRDNILKPEYENIAIAAVKGDFTGKETTVIVEMFAKPMNYLFDFNNMNNLLFRVQNYLFNAY